MDAVVYDSVRCGKHSEYRMILINLCQWKERLTQNGGGVLVTASIAIGVVESSVVRLIDPLPEDGVEELLKQRVCVNDRKLHGLIQIKMERTVGGASSMPAQMGMFTGTNAASRNATGMSSPVWGWTADSTTPIQRIQPCQIHRHRLVGRHEI
jgi:hypothetical protein